MPGSFALPSHSPPTSPRGCPQHAGGAVRGFYVALRKSELSVETGLALRDLRVLDSVLQSQVGGSP